MNSNVRRATIVLALMPVMSVPVAALAATAPIAPLAAKSIVSGTMHRLAPASAKPAAHPAARTTASGTTVTTTHTDAPASSASATAANVLGQIIIGDTSANAGSGGGKAHAHALDLLGTTIAGGDSTGGTKKGNLFALPDNPLAELELAPYAATVTSNAGGTQSSAEAALAHADAAGLLEVWVLHSVSTATWTPDASHGHSTSDGAEANLGGGALDVKVLHAETDSDGKGSSALVVLNGTGIGTNDQLGSVCQVNADPLLDLLCLQASGGKGSDGSTTSSAFVGQVTGAVPGTTVTGASSSGGKVATPGTPSTPAGHHKSSHGPLPHTTGPSTGRLPFTGGPIALLAGYAAALAGLGGALISVARRRRDEVLPA